MKMLGGYLISVAAASILISVLSAVLPNGAGKRTISFVGTVLLILTIFSPFVKVDSREMAGILSRYRMQIEEIRTGIPVQNRELIASLIKEKTEAYIWDKAAQLGMQAEITVSLQKEAMYPTPNHVKISGQFTVQQQGQLSRFIEENLGIPPEEQQWQKK